MAVVLTNNATSLLAGAIDAAATTLSIDNSDAGKFPNPAEGDWFPLTIVDNAGNMEVLKATARAGAIITVERAKEGTTAKAFAAGARVDLRLTTSAMFEVTPSAIEAATDAETGFDNANSRFTWFDTVERKLKKMKWASLVTALNEALSFVKLSGGKASGEITSTSANAFRMAFGTGKSFLWRKDENDLYGLIADTPDGSFNSLRPISINLASGLTTLGHGLNVSGNVSATGNSYAGSGAAYLNGADGNVYGSSWGRWGVTNWAFDAINNRIEKRGAEYADDRKNGCVTDTRFAGWVEHTMAKNEGWHAPSGYVFTYSYRNSGDQYNFGARQPQVFIPYVGWRALGAW
nr:MAG TPA: tail fiber protein [Caudoviricetes sp.]